MDKFFPLVIITLNFCACIVSAFYGKFWPTVYWFTAAWLNMAALMMSK